MALDPNSNNPVSATRHRDSDCEVSSGDFDALVAPSSSVYLRRESHFLQSIFIQNIDSGTFHSLCRACKVPITHEGAEELLSTLLYEKIPSSRTLSGRIHNQKSIHFKSALELVAGKGGISQSQGFYLVGTPDEDVDISITHKKRSTSLSLNIQFDHSEVKRIRSLYAHWQKCERIMSACGVTIPQKLSLNNFPEAVGFGVEDDMNWYRAKLNRDTFISVADMSKELHRRSNGQQGMAVQPKVSCYQPNMILFNRADTPTLIRVVRAIELSGCLQPMDSNKREALVRLLSSILSTLESGKGDPREFGEVKGGNLSDLLFEFANDSSPLYLDVGLRCDVHGGWKNRQAELLDRVEVKIHGFAPRWGEAFSLFIKLDPNQSNRPLLGLEWDQGSVDMKGAAEVTLRQVSSFISEFASLRRNRKCSEGDVMKVIQDEIKSIAQDDSPLLFRPVAIGSDSVNVGFYERTVNEGEDVINL